MFHHAAATGKGEHNQAICWGRWEPSAERDVEREPTAMELVQSDSSLEDTADLYYVYQLLRLLGKIHCDEEMEAHICQEIMDSVKEYLSCKQLSALPGAEPRQSPADIPKLDPHSMPGTVPLMIGSWALSETPAKKLWMWQEMPTNRHWQPQHFWRIKLRGWATLSAAVTNAPEATDAQAATSETHKWHHAMGTLLKGEPSHPALPIETAGNLHPLIIQK